jgi:hypothetical protein
MNLLQELLQIAESDREQNCLRIKPQLGDDILNDPRLKRLAMGIASVIIFDGNDMLKGIKRLGSVDKKVINLSFLASPIL